MFDTLSEEQYINLVEYSKNIYQKEVMKNGEMGYKNFDLELQRLRIEHAFKKHKYEFDSDNQRIIFKLNMVISDNQAFLSTFLNACSIYLKQTKFKKIEFLFGLRRSVLTPDWEKIIAHVANVYKINEQTALWKIAEIVKFSNIYIKEAENEVEASVKSLSQR